MAYDETVAARLRGAVMRARPEGLIDERKMFGGLALLLDGSMAWGVLGGELLVRVTEADADAALGRPHARPFDFTGRPTRTLLYVAPAGFGDERELDAWVALGIAGSRAAAAKKKTARPRAAKPRVRAPAKPRVRAR